MKKSWVFFKLRMLQLKSDKTSLFFSYVLPVLLLLGIGFPLQVRDGAVLDVAYNDAVGSAQSQALVESLRKRDYVKLTEYPGDLASAQAALRENELKHYLRIEPAAVDAAAAGGPVAYRVFSNSLSENQVESAALRGLRKLLTLGDDAHRVSVSVVPLPSQCADDTPVVLVVLGKRQVCEVLSVQGFARSYGLSAAETRVLALLCHGTPPTKIAAQFGVAISTVRSQIGNIRIKTGAESIRALVRQVAVLPPLMGVLRGEPRVATTWNDAGLISA